MRIITTLCLFAFLLSACSSQFYQMLETPLYENSSKEFDRKYDAFIGEQEVKVATWYHYVKTLDTLNNVYILRVFFPETKQLTSEATYTDKECLIQNGPSKKWSEEGKKNNEGQYVNGKKEGEWHYFARDTLIWSIGNYRAGKEIGLWKNYNRYNGVLTEEVNYEDGNKVGPFIKYDTLGNVYKKGVYQADTILEETIVNDEHVKKIEDYDLGEMPEFPGGEMKMLEYLYSNINYPPIAREYNIQGLCVASFVINEEGEIEDVKVPVGLCESMKAECKRIIESMPTWKPGTKDGKPVRVSYNLPIRFKMQ